MKTFVYTTHLHDGKKIQVECDPARENNRTHMCEQHCKIPRKDYYDDRIKVYAEPTDDHGYLASFELVYGMNNNLSLERPLPRPKLCVAYWPDMGGV